MLRGCVDLLTVEYLLSETLRVTAYVRASAKKEPGPRIPREASRDSKMLHSIAHSPVSSTGNLFKSNIKNIA